MPDRLTTREAMNKYGLSQVYLRRLCTQGRLKFERVATILLIDKSSLDAYVKEAKEWKAAHGQGTANKQTKTK